MSEVAFDWAARESFLVDQVRILKQQVSRLTHPGRPRKLRARALSVVESPEVSAWRAHSEVLMKFIALKRSGRLPGVPRHAGIWVGRGSRYIMFSELPPFGMTVTVGDMKAMMEEVQVA